MVTSLRVIRIKFLFFFLILLLITACSKNKDELSINEKFYTDLAQQVNEEHFSPLKFAGQQKKDLSEADWKFDKSHLEIKTDSGITALNFDPIGLKHTKGKQQHSEMYTIHVFYSDGVEKVISSLQNPERKEKDLHFSTQDANVTVILQPQNHYVKWQVLPHKKELIDSIVVKSDVNGPFYGGGERYIGTCLNGKTVSNQPNDHYWDPPKTDISPWGNPHEPGHYDKYEPTYLQIPFYLNPRGFALYVDDAASTFASFASNGEGFSIRIENNQAHFYTIHQNSPKEALRTYTRMLGRQPELPDWAVGVWVNLLDGQDSVYSKANRLKEWKIPATAIWVFDMGDIESSQGYENWTTGPYWNLREMTDSLHTLGFKVLSYLHPYQEPKLPKSDTDNPYYKKLDSLGVLLVTPQNIRNDRYGHDINGLYNFHLPLMGDLWQQMLENVLVRDNFDGYMEDFGDLSYAFDREQQEWVAIDYGQETNLTANQYNNSYPLIYHKLSYLQAKEISPDIATFCRSGSLGTAAYSKIIWGGDQMSNWNKTFGYPSVISSGISCGLSGYGNWAPDILSSSPDMELWKRWVQFAAFTPILRDHLWINEPTSVDIWFNSETPQYFKRYADIHMSLVPYIQETLKEYRETGTPMIRHMMLEFPEEPESYSCEYQYMFGPKYLVAPIVEKGALDKKIYFPKGEWKSYWDATTIESNGEWITVSAPLETIPVYMKMTE